MKLKGQTIGFEPCQIEYIQSCAIANKCSFAWVVRDIVDSAMMVEDAGYQKGERLS